MDYLDIWEGINAELFHGFSSNEISIEVSIYTVKLGDKELLGYPEIVP